MTNVTLHKIEEGISIKSLRDFILDMSLTEHDTILLHQYNYDDIMLEYREAYKESLNGKYYIISVLILEDIRSSVPQNRIGVIKNDYNRYKNDYKSESFKVINTPDDSYAYDVIYRCGWCGNVVDFDGAEFDPEIRAFKIKTHQKFKHTITEIKVNGYCCREKHSH